MPGFISSASGDVFQLKNESYENSIIYLFGGDDYDGGQRGCSKLDGGCV
jgi:hypothetical protein